MKKSKLLALLITIYIITWSVIPSLYSLNGEVKYFSFIFIILLFILIAYKYPLVIKVDVFTVPIFLLFFIGTFHINDTTTLVNIATIILSSMTIYFFAKIITKLIKENEIITLIEKALLISMLLSFAISILLTSMSIDRAPIFYPWEAIYTDYRLQLIDGKSGLTPVLWIAALYSIFYISSSRKINIKFIFTLSLLLIILILTKSRLGLIFLILIIGFLSEQLLQISHKKIRATISALLIFAFSLYTLITYNEAISQFTFDVAKNIQENLPFVRIVSSDYGITSNRDLLNIQLIEEAQKSPFVGLGSNAPILRYGVNNQGEISNLFFENSVTSSESGLRLAVKYGWLYYTSILSMLVTLLLLSKNNGDGTLFYVSGVVLTTFIFNGAFESYYSLSAVFLLLLIILKNRDHSLK